MDYKHRLLLSAAIAAAMLAGAAQAQDARGNQIEELVVTAEKREQSLQDVPVAVSAFSDERREVVGINSVQDLTNFTPGLSYSTNNDRIALRGIGRFTNNRSTEGGVAMYSDGFYTSSVTSFARSTLFIERTEVLRGPQGTLYGRNSIGGALNIITKRPTDEFEGEVRATFQNFDYQTYEATVSGPLLQWGNVRGRVAGSYSSQDKGYFKNLSGGEDEGGRGDEWQIEYQIDGETDDGKFEWWFKGNTAEWHNVGRGPGGRSGRTIGVRENGLLFATGLTPSSNFGFTDPLPGNDCSRCFSTNDGNYISLENVSFTLNTVLHLEGFDVKYTGGHNYYDYRLQTDLDGTARTTSFLVTRTTPNVLPATATNPLGLGTTNIPAEGIFISPRQHNQYHEEVWWFSNEINFASTTDGPAQWLFGVYQYREGSNYTLSDARYPDDPRFETPFNPLTQTPAAPNPLRRYALGSSENVNESYAAYGQIDYKLTEAWKITAGLRYTLDKKQSFESARLFC
ncbi:TonB-dependent receptor, partial [Phenylobacterium sp.]|uniref:TonB-dependent receptor n=1 Tax=Phenylobacterium sp. TaxID=1871053 RepID=UPI0039831F43